MNLFTLLQSSTKQDPSTKISKASDTVIDSFDNDPCSSNPSV